MHHHARTLWPEQCQAAEDIRERYGLAKAIGYLVGEKFVNLLREVPAHPELESEVAPFVEKIRDIFDIHELAGWFANTKRIGPFGHILNKDEHRALVEADALDTDPVAGAEDVLAFERARELLLPRD
ncbi:MAG: hypothetical protein PF961_09660 [Planctomycetota bacterium]|jgi:hypothetical protein|nr:hypothetical protein [Planctomycetota bacterium]